MSILSKPKRCADVQAKRASIYSQKFSFVRVDYFYL
ncbi:gp37 [Erwinia phage vB_EamM-Y2]|uniref:Gp37 n=1 Tax=Erwinia phage vB_EamM-Y2 TaxID=1051676 RepID=G0YPY6_9CAUD|nr:gp37 [Erwinia phage vB_EamM-Y2]AEJ81413.1 gp37 [Erwinia phage vB_EamM-Y2]